jgi:hypothetical protein
MVARRVAGHEGVATSPSSSEAPSAYATLASNPQIPAMTAVPAGAALASRGATLVRCAIDDATVAPTADLA